MLYDFNKQFQSFKDFSFTVKYKQKNALHYYINITKNHTSINKCYSEITQRTTANSLNHFTNGFFLKRKYYKKAMNE